MSLSRKMLYVFGLFAIGAGLIIFSPPAVQAVENDDDTVTTETTTSSESEKDEQIESSRSRVRVEAVESAVIENRAKAEKEVASERKTRVQLDDDTRTQLCENRKETIQNKVKAYSGHANAYLDRLDGVDYKLKAYLAANTIEGLSLNAVDESQETAAQKVLALEEIVGTAMLDCSKLTDNATWLTQVRTAATEAKDALKAYRTELKKVVAAIAAAQIDAKQEDSNSTSTESGDGTSTEGEQQGV